MSRMARMGGDAMASVAGNFDRELTIEGGKVQLSGPLELAEGQTLLTMYVWLWQTDGDGRGAAATAVLDDRDLRSADASQSGRVWETTVQPQHGTFTAGPATGMALAILRRKDGSTFPYWWSHSNIRLAPAGTTFVAGSNDVDTPLVKAFRAFIEALAKG